MPAPKEILDLIERFSRHKDEYTSGKYNETQLRREFVDPFFKALGWDVDNEQGYSPAYRDVIHEDSIAVGSMTKAPDYCFRIGKERKFFVEAKKPSIDIKGDIHPAFQVRRYAWSAKLPLSILTDFEELAVYDCRIKPKKGDKASVARIHYVYFTDLATKWDEVASLFSKEAVLKGSFDKYAETKRQGTSEIDDVFLEDIEAWRKELAKNLAINNGSLTQRQLNYAVQKIIDRIIFLRICEDRKIEISVQLMALLNGTNIYSRLCEIFRKADDKYNSGLFHFNKIDDVSEEVDEFTLALKIDDVTLKDIIKKLYFPESPYEFSYVPADILGQVYEQFLGKVIRLTKTHTAEIEEKPEVRKAGGVYYTPTYIVEYIVKNTVGKLIEGKNPDQVSKIKILDPACGSGSFLISAYQYLIDWHRDWYIQNEPEKWAKKKNPRMYKNPIDEWVLSINEKKRILLNNIFGVDIDPQAVEVTKLSLLLKVLEGETDPSLNTQLSMFQDRVLPNLGNNIKCGNSLIGSDYYNGQLKLLCEEDIYKVNAFDWDKAFPEVINNGGFNVVIGNPPWGASLLKPEKLYLNDHYVNKRGEAESHLYFIEKGSVLLNKNGILGYITPNTWLSVRNSLEIRHYILENTKIVQICELSKYIFQDAPDIVPIMIFLNSNIESDFPCIVRMPNTDKITSANFHHSFVNKTIDQGIWKSQKELAINIRLSSEHLAILNKCKINSVPLGDISTLLYGIKTGDNSKYLSTKLTNNHNVKALKTGEIGRYRICWKQLFLWWTPALAGYRKSKVNVPKIVIQYIRKISLKRRIIAALDTNGDYYPLNNYSYILQRDSNYTLKYILGVLNSQLMNFYYANSFIDYNIKPSYLQNLPIIRASYSNKSIRNSIIKKAEQIIKVNERLLETKTEQEKSVLQRQIEMLDRQIDQLVYGLYDLTDEEISIVENPGE